MNFNNLQKIHDILSEEKNCSYSFKFSDGNEEIIFSRTIDNKDEKKERKVGFSA